MESANGDQSHGAQQPVVSCPEREGQRTSSSLEATQQQTTQPGAAVPPEPSSPVPAEDGVATAGLSCDRAIGGDRPIGAARPRPSVVDSKESKYGSLSMGEYVPTTREIESGAVVVTEVKEVKDNSSVATADLQPVEDTAQGVEFAVGNIATKNWELRFDVMHILRRLLKFCPECIAEHLAIIGQCIIESMKNPRSSIMREALMLTSDIFMCRPLTGEMQKAFTWTKLVPALLQKGINDKKFVRDEGLAALDSFTKVSPTLYAVFLPDCENRNTKIASMAMRTVENCVRALGSDLCSIQLKEGPPLQPLLACAVKAMLKGKLADMRTSGKNCVQIAIEQSGGWETFSTIYQTSLSAADMKQMEKEFGPKVRQAEVAAEGLSGIQEAKKLARASKRDQQIIELDKEVFSAEVPMALPDDEDPNEEGDTPLRRLRRNSTTPRSRKKAEVIVMEF